MNLNKESGVLPVADKEKNKEAHDRIRRIAARKVASGIVSDIVTSERVLRRIFLGFFVAALHQDAMCKSVTIIFPRALQRCSKKIRRLFCKVLIQSAILFIEKNPLVDDFEFIFVSNDLKMTKLIYRMIEIGFGTGRKKREARVARRRLEQKFGKEMVKNKTVAVGKSTKQVMDGFKTSLGKEIKEVVWNITKLLITILAPIATLIILGCSIYIYIKYRQEGSEELLRLATRQLISINNIQAEAPLPSIRRSYEEEFGINVIVTPNWKDFTALIAARLPHINIEPQTPSQSLSSK